MHQVHDILRAICSRAGSPLAQQVLGHADKGEWLEIQKLHVDPRNYESAFQYWVDAQCVDLCRKIDLRGDVDTAQAAVGTFLETERDCYSVNRRIRTLLTAPEGKPREGEEAFLDFLVKWKGKIRYAMGKAPEIIEPGFSGGSTTATRRLFSTIIDKLSTTPDRYGHSAFDADIWFYTSAWGSIACERNLYPVTAHGNEYFVVPKNGLTGRSCCKEAPINLAMQLGLGTELRVRARKRLGIDLDHGAELHQQLAREGSVTGGWATLDMSSASDRWARELIRFLIDDVYWASYLNATRATHTLFGGKRLYLEKFSSMGNGFTFELETILFATLALTVAEIEKCDGEIHCYGDDLIVPTGLAPSVLMWLAQVGHKPNLRKSHISGPFRESCGGDFFRGEAVSTAKLEEIPKGPQHWISLANNLRRVAGGRPEYWGLVAPAWRKCLSFLPRQVRDCRGPEHLGDQVIHDSPEYWTVKNGTVRAYSPVVAKRNLGFYKNDPLATIIAMTLSSEPLSKGIPLREVAGYRLRRLSATPESHWLPGEAWRKVDPRIGESKRRTQAALMRQVRRVRLLKQTLDQNLPPE